MHWQSAVQAESDKQRFTYNVPVREPSVIMSHPRGCAKRVNNFSQILERAAWRRLRPGLAAYIFKTR